MVLVGPCRTKGSNSVPTFESAFQSSSGLLGGLSGATRTVGWKRPQDSRRGVGNEIGLQCKVMGILASTLLFGVALGHSSRGANFGKSALKPTLPR